MVLKKSRIAYIFSIIIFLFIVSGCGGGDDAGVNTGSGSFTYTLTDTSINYADGHYYVSVFSGTSAVPDSSTATAQSLINGNTVVIGDLQSNTAYAFYIWIDEDGDGLFGDDMQGTVAQTDAMPSDIEVELSDTFLNFENKPITIAQDPNLALKTVRCFWLVDGALTENTKDLLGGDQSQREQVNTIIGMVNATFDASGNQLITSTGDTDLPVPTISSYSGILYDLYCFTDVNGDDSRGTGDYEASETDVVCDDTGVSIVLSRIQ